MSSLSKVDLADQVRQAWLFDQLTRDEAFALAPFFNRQELRKGSILLRQGQKHEHIAIILEGEVAVIDPGNLAYDPQQQVRILSTLHTGDMFGEQSWLDGLPASASILVKEDSSLWMISFKDFDNYVASNPGAYISILKKLAVNLSLRLRSKQQKP